MCAINCIFCGLALLAAAVRADEQSELVAVKRLLNTTINELQPKVKSDDGATAELKKLKSASDQELARMARDVKSQFKVEKLDDEAVKKAEAAMKKAIKDTDAAKLIRMLKQRDGEVVIQMCWLFGCK